MTAATTAIAPYQPASGVPMREQLSHALGHITRFQSAYRDLAKKHEVTTKEHEIRHKDDKTKLSKLGQGGVGLALTAINTVVSGACGFADGRYPGEHGYAEIPGLRAPVDATVAALGLSGAIANLVFDGRPELTTGLFTVGNAGVGLVAHRALREKGAEWKEKADAAKAGAAAANGAKGGTVYTVAAPHPATK